MLVGIDGNEANIENRVGVNEYAFQVLWGLWRITNSDREKKSEKKMPKDRPNYTQNSTYKPIVIHVFLKRPPLSSMPPETECFKYKILSGGPIWILTCLTPHLFLTREKYNVFFTPSHYLPPILRFPTVCSIMDLGYLEFSGQFRKYDFWQLKLWSAWSMTISKQIITISSSSKKDIVRHYPKFSDKVSVTYPGYDDKAYTASRVRVDLEGIKRVKDKYTIVSDYVLYLGTLKPSKNIEGLVDAWGKIVNNHNNFSLVIAGKKGWLYSSIFEKVKALGLEEKIVFTDFVPEDDKKYLIKGAYLFTLPSYWEGFGLDVLSAMASGIPVIVSSYGSLPEVAGDAGILVDPNNTDEIAEKISKVLSMNKKEYNSLVEKGLNQVKKFSWEDMSYETLEVLIKASA